MLVVPRNNDGRAGRALEKKFSFMEEEDESISLGSNSTEASNEIGKKCLVMKVLAHRSISLEPL